MRATKAQTEFRIDEVLRIVIDGGTFYDLRDYAREKCQEGSEPWGTTPLSDGQLRRYLHAANARIAETCKEGRKQLLRRHLAQRKALYARAIQCGELGTALSVLKDEATLCGLYPPTKVAPTNPKGDKPYEPIALTDDERRAALDRLYASVGAGKGGPVADGTAEAG